MDEARGKIMVRCALVLFDLKCDGSNFCSLQDINCLSPIVEFNLRFRCFDFVPPSVPLTVLDYDRDLNNVCPEL